MLNVRLVLVLASAMAAPHVFAQTLPPSVIACADETDVLKRLSCYDREVARYRTQHPAVSTAAPPAVVGAAAPTPSTSTGAAPNGAMPSGAVSASAGAHGASAPAPAGAGVPVAAAPSASRPAPTGVPGGQAASAGSASPSDLQAEFGMNGEIKRKESPAAAEPAKLDKLTARIASLSYKARGESILTLDDGQVWEEAENKTHVPFHVNDEVTINRGVLGAFYLSSAEVRGLRVKRVR